MLITNHSRHCLGVNSKEFIGYIQPRSSLEVPDDAARHWLTKATPAHFRERGLISISEAPAVTEETTTEETKRPHWRTAIAAIKATGDLDALMDLHNGEDRPKVLAAIEARMETLNGETYAGE